MQKPRGKKAPPGARALQGSGDGFWELDLRNGTAWFSDWFYDNLDWSGSDHRPTWSSLRPLMPPETWTALLDEMRRHLEVDIALDVEVPVQVGGGEPRWWQIRGRAERNALRQPMHLAGCVRDVSAEHRRRAELADEIAWLRGAFDAFPVAAAVLDIHDRIVGINRCWRERGANDPWFAEHGRIGAALPEDGRSTATGTRLLRRPIGDAGAHTLVLAQDSASHSVSS